MATLITANNLTKYYHGQAMVDKVSLRIDAGQIISLIGPNGAGKSTLLKMLVGLERPDAGELSVSPDAIIGYVPQSLEFPASFPINVRAFLHLLHKEVSHEAMREQLAEMEVEPLFDKQLHTLSGGELRRVLLARALLRQPNILILDEPVGGLDINSQAQIYEIIARINKQTGCAVLMVSHDLHMVMAEADYVICLYHHICCEGAPEKINTSQEFVQLFGHDVANRLAVYAHEHNHYHDMHGTAHGEGYCTHLEHQANKQHLTSKGQGNE